MRVCSQGSLMCKFSVATDTAGTGGCTYCGDCAYQLPLKVSFGDTSKLIWQKSIDAELKLLEEIRDLLKRGGK